MGFKDHVEYCSVKENWTPLMIYIHRSRIITGAILGVILGLCLGCLLWGVDYAF